MDYDRIFAVDDTNYYGIYTRELVTFQQKIRVDLPTNEIEIGLQDVACFELRFY